jgi:hypothetical protein
VPDVPVELLLPAHYVLFVVPVNLFFPRDLGFCEVCFMFETYKNDFVKNLSFKLWWSWNNDFFACVNHCNRPF